MFDRDAETRKYDWLYGEQEYKPGSNELYKWAVSLGYDFTGWTVNDYGCGRGLLRTRWNFSEYTGVDIAREHIDRMNESAGIGERFICSPLHEMDSSVPVADIGWSSDVMEHLDPMVVIPSLEKMIQKSVLLWLLICCKEAKVLGPNGEQLHLTVESPEWWIGTVGSVGRVLNKKEIGTEVMILCAGNPDK